MPQTTLFPTQKNFQRRRVRIVTAPNGLIHEILDCNDKVVASVQNVGANGWNVRIDSTPRRYAAGVKTATPEAAYEYARLYANDDTEA